MCLLNLGALGLVGACGGSGSEENTASHVFYGGVISTLNPSSPQVEAIAIAGSTVLAAGNESEIVSLTGPETIRVDLKGRTLMPSLKDHHLHLLNVGFSVLNRDRGEPFFLDLSGTRSPEEIGRRVAERTTQMPRGSWILGQGWNQGAWGTAELPTHQVLDRAAPQNPVYLVRVDGHCGWANSEAMRVTGIKKETPEPAGGSIRRFPDGSPTGILLERANELVVPFLPPLTDRNVIDAFLRGAHSLSSQGITEIYDAGFLAVPSIVALNIPLERYLQLLLDADREQPLPLKVNLMVPSPSPFADEVISGAVPRNPSERIRITHIKLYMDGALGSRGADLRHPYHDDPATRGVPRMTESELRNEVRKAIDAGLDVATHAIGDKAIGDTLRVYQALLEERPRLDPQRLRIEHFSYGMQADLELTAKLGIVNVIQPGFIYPDGQGVTMEDARLGPERVAGAYAFGSLLRMGARLAGSSDDFATLLPPFWNFYAAATRKSPPGSPSPVEGWHPGERLSRKEALRLFTRFYPPGGGGASPGQIQAGAQADFIILSGDPLTGDESDLLEIRVLATMREGRVTFSDSSIDGLK